MKATFYFNWQDRRVIDKRPISIVSNKTIKYKDDTSLINPTFIVRASDYSSDTNYIKIVASSGDPEFVGRYYYIEDAVFSHMEVYLKCSIDVLKSHENMIKNQMVTFKRSEKYDFINLHLNDPEFVLENRTRFQTVPFEKGFSASFQDSKGAYPILTLNGSGAVN